jgi:hypothetical protein
MNVQSPAFRLLRETLVQVAVPVALIVLGTASVWLYDNARLLHRFSQGISSYIATFIAQFALYVIACYAVVRSTRRRRIAVIITMAIIGFFAVVFRERLVTQPPYLSSDVNRYVWDGRVQAAGINPYRYIPSAPELEHLRDDQVYPGINRRDFARTIYPPAAQAIFLSSHLLKPMSLETFKLLMSLFDGLAALAICLALSRLNIDPARVIIFAWHPLVVWEGAHSGHIESATMAFIAFAALAWSHKKETLTGVALALATLTKYYPGLLLLVLLTARDEGETRPAGLVQRLRRRFSIRTLIAFLATIIIAYLPYLSVGSGVLGYLPGYFKEEGFVESGSRYFLLELARLVAPVPTTAYAATAVVVLLGAVVWWTLRREREPLGPIRASLAIVGLFLILTTPRYAWYIAWIIPFLCFAPSVAWFYLTGASILLYTLWLTTDYPNIPLWLGTAMYVPTILLLCWEGLQILGFKTGAGMARNRRSDTNGL